MGVTDINYVASDERVKKAMSKSDYVRPSLKNLIGKSNLIGVEIGVQLGVNAYSILTNYDINMLYLVDPYSSYLQTDRDIEEVNNEEAELIRLKAVEVLSPFVDKINWVRESSQEADKDIPNNLDFAYIDGYHVQDVIKSDIEMCYKKLKSGGLLAGHDVNKSIVYEMAISFFGSINIEQRDWWIIK